VCRQQGFVAGLRQAGTVERNQLQAPSMVKLDLPFGETKGMAKGIAA
jgi:hypothetical protein